MKEDYVYLFLVKREEVIITGFTTIRVDWQLPIFSHTLGPISLSKKLPKDFFRGPSLSVKLSK
jgi:hypothetical protein